MTTALTTAQKVRLWFAGGTQLFAFIFLFSVPLVSSSNQYQLADGQTGSLVSGQTIVDTSLYGLVAFAILFQVAAVVLASISLYRFVKPYNPALRFAQTAPPGYYVPGAPVSPEHTAPHSNYGETPRA